MRIFLTLLVIANVVTARAGWAQSASPPQSIANSPIETVTVTGAQLHDAITGFVQSLVTPTRANGQLARWQRGICPVTFGLAPAYDAFISRHLKDIAVQAGAPVNPDPSCAKNIGIVFTAAPQALLNDIRKTHPDVLGYYDNQDQLDKLAIITHPIQAWYMTTTKDVNGNVRVDTSKRTGPGMIFTIPCPTGPGACSYQYPDAHAAAANGSLISNGLSSGLYNVIIVADPTRLTDHNTGPIGDYIAMLALAQIALPDGCRQLPSVLNMLTANCVVKTEALTDNDTAFLKGLYKTKPDRSALTQRGEIVNQMQQSLESNHAAGK